MGLIHNWYLQVQIYAYNSELYENATEARSRAYGIAAVSMFVKVANAKEALPKTGQHFLKESNLSKPNLELKMLTDQLQHIIYKGDSVVLKALSVHELLPNTSALITYEGSLTAPGCEETATWILLNRPLYVSSQQVQIYCWACANLECYSAESKTSLVLPKESLETLILLPKMWTLAIDLPTFHHNPVVERAFHY